MPTDAFSTSLSSVARIIKDTERGKVNHSGIQLQYVVCWHITLPTVRLFAVRQARHSATPVSWYPSV